MVIAIDEQDLKHGLLGLVIALIEVIQEALRHQALKRMEGGSLTEGEVERLGTAFLELDKAIEEIKAQQGLDEAVRSVREGLDKMVDEVIDAFICPELEGTMPRRGTDHVL